jgi:hypothetical protein
VQSYAYSYSVKQQSRPQDSPAAGRSAEQLGSAASEEEMKSESPSPHQRSQQGGGDAVCSHFSDFDNQPIVLSDDSSDNDSDGDVEEGKSVLSNTSVV